MPGLFSSVSEALVVELERCDLPACRTRIYEINEFDTPAKFDGVPIIAVSKNQITSARTCRGPAKTHEITVLFTIIDCRKQDCGVCDTEQLDEFNGYVDRVRECICDLDYLSIQLPDPYRFSGMSDLALELDDIETTRLTGGLATTLEMTFHVCEQG